MQTTGDESLCQGFVIVDYERQDGRFDKLERAGSPKVIGRKMTARHEREYEGRRCCAHSNARTFSCPGVYLHAEDDRRHAQTTSPHDSSDPAGRPDPKRAQNTPRPSAAVRPPSDCMSPLRTVLVLQKRPLLYFAHSFLTGYQPK